MRITRSGSSRMRQVCLQRLPKFCRNASRLEKEKVSGAIATLIAVMPRLQSEFLRFSRSNEGFEKLQYSLRLLLRALSSADSPVVLYLDDLQWIDPDTLSILRSFAVESKLKHFLFVGAYRDNKESTQTTKSQICWAL
jgi:predicted ATPase